MALMFLLRFCEKKFFAWYFSWFLFVLREGRIMRRRLWNLEILVVSFLISLWRKAVSWQSWWWLVVIIGYYLVWSWSWNIQIEFSVFFHIKKSVSCIATIEILKSAEISDSKELVNLIVLGDTMHILVILVSTFC